MQDRIISFLKEKEGYISGDQLAHRLKISRQALWKHVQELRDAGYEIVAIPHLGYQLVSIPDRLFPQEVHEGLHTHCIGKKIYYFDKLSSTMDEAMRLGFENAPEGTVVIAESQGCGRGRMGRQWVSPKYKGIYLSLIVKPNIIPSQTPLLTLMTAVCVCEAIRQTTGLEAQIKWPNDILLAHRKVSGILTELKAELDAVSFVLIGIGLNVNSERSVLPEGATSLKEQLKGAVNRLALLKYLLQSLEDYYFLFKKEGPEPILARWRSYALTLGKRVKVMYQRRHVEGEALDIDDDGGLLIRNDAGLIDKVTAGDVIHCR
ncbi:MAG: biotin--[acetyl-CoA-carboxylase] ligase [Candidatus Omnitrophota bacterium]|jgi:BirA family biotin operon repressor/biotin-[acetyl-CoA-carboxylase] ligase|nr:MAG: biotin--[acetyl-CoA-carboxylase] ligase [Candidatus Omnitrophota bacterium]